ncbi:MAG: hypothetical protein ABW352_09185 [Polyangiales bacterium]
MPWLLLLLALSFASPALACFGSPFASGWPVRTFGTIYADDGSQLVEVPPTVPGNLVYFLVTDESVPLVLETLDGSRVAASTRTIGRDRVFAPDAPIAAGTKLRLRWTPSQAERAGEYVFATGPASSGVDAPLTLAIDRRGVVSESDLGGGPAAFTRVVFGWPAQPHLTTLEVHVDGKRAVDLWGEPYAFSVRSLCALNEPTLDTCGLLHAVPVGTHTLTITRRVVGSDREPETASLSVSTSCSELPWLGLDAGAPLSFVDAGQVLDAASVQDASLGPDAAPSMRNDDGCRLARGPFDGAWLLLGLALLWRRKRAAWLALPVLLCASPALACYIDSFGKPWPVRVFPVYYPLLDGGLPYESPPIPGNLVYFEVTDETAPVTLEMEDGTPIAASVRTIGRDRVYAPDAPLAPGTKARVRWLSRNGVDAYSHEFVTAAWAELEVSPIVVADVESGVMPLQYANFSESHVRVSFERPASEHLVVVSYMLDGEPAPVGINEPFSFLLRSTCGSTEPLYDWCGLTASIPEGPHTLTVTRRVVGADAEPSSLTLALTTSCDNPGVLSPPPEADAGRPDAMPERELDATVRDEDAGFTRRDASVRRLDASVDVGSPDVADDGCQLARPSFDGAWLALPLLLRRRRRKRA